MIVSEDTLKRLSLFAFKRVETSKFKKTIGSINNFIEQEINIEDGGFLCYRTYSNKIGAKREEYFTDNLSRAILWCGSGIYK